MALSKDEIFEAIKELPVIELAGLVKDLEEDLVLAQPQLPLPSLLLQVPQPQQTHPQLRKKMTSRLT